MRTRRLFNVTWYLQACKKILRFVLIATRTISRLWDQSEMWLRTRCLICDYVKCLRAGGTSETVFETWISLHGNEEAHILWAQDLASDALFCEAHKDNWESPLSYRRHETIALAPTWRGSVMDATVIGTQRTTLSLEQWNGHATLLQVSNVAPKLPPTESSTVFRLHFHQVQILFLFIKKHEGCWLLQQASQVA